VIPEKSARRLVVVQRVEGDHVWVGGRRLLNMASNNYLGLLGDPLVKAATVEAIEEWGTGSGSSPLLSGYSDLHHRLANRLTAWKCGAAWDPDGTAQEPTTAISAPSDWEGSFRTLLFSSGYAANLAVLSTLLPDDAQVFSDRRNHASLVDGLRLAGSLKGLQVRYYRHRDFQDLERLLAQSEPDRPRWIVTDSVFSMDGTCTRPSDLALLAARFQAGVVVDEAHASGVCGDRGAGLYSLAPAADGERLVSGFSPNQLLIVGTLSKALAAQGGFVTGHVSMIEPLLQAARPLIYSTSLTPASIAAADQAVRIASGRPELRARLQSHVAALHTAARTAGWSTVGEPDAPLLGIIVGTADQAVRLSDAFLEHGIWAPAIRPPTVRPLECRLRLSPTASMDDRNIARVVAALSELRPPPPSGARR
jgi:8-amino-7-oxononanoate synthase